MRIARTSAAHSINSLRVVAKMRPLGMAPCQWPDAADALPGDSDGSRRADLADQIDGADIDSEFQRRGRHESLHFAGL